MSVSSTASLTYHNFEHILILKDGKVLEKRSLNQVEIVSLSIELDEKVTFMSMKQLSLSNDGKTCVIGCGRGKQHFYLIDLEQNVQHKLTSGTHTGTYCPCFINGQCAYVAVGGRTGEGVEVWSVKQKSATKLLKVDNQGTTRSMTSTNNILAVSSGVGNLYLWDVRNWEVFYTKTFCFALLSF